MIALVIAALAVVYVVVVVRTTNRRWCRDLELHDWRSQPGATYDACQCGATRLKVTP